MTTTTVQLAQRGLITLPKALRDAYKLKEGDALTIMDIGGAIVIMPVQSKIDRLTDTLAERMKAKDVTLEMLLQEARDVREGK